MKEESRETMMRRLFHEERCSISEIAEYLGCTRGDVRAGMVAERSWPKRGEMVDVEELRVAVGLGPLVASIGRRVGA